jgi:hypothetical protein
MHTTQRRQREQKPGAVKTALVGLLGVAIGFTVMTVVSSRVMELYRGSQPDLATSTLQQSVEADLENKEGLTLQSDVSCVRSSEYGIWNCSFMSRDAQSTLRVRWYEDGSFSYVGGFGQED